MIFRSRKSERPLDHDILTWAEDVRISKRFGQETLSKWLSLDRRNKTFADPEILLGAAVSGAAVIDSGKFWDEIIVDEKIVGLDMEAFGFAYAAAAGGNPNYRKQWMVAKSVCDYGVKKEKDAQAYAAFCSVKFVEFFLNDYVMRESFLSSPAVKNVM
jgi:nucleoside phosphorylase